MPIQTQRVLNHETGPADKQAMALEQAGRPGAQPPDRIVDLFAVAMLIERHAEAVAEVQQLGETDGKLIHERPRWAIG